MWKTKKEVKKNFRRYTDVFKLPRAPSRPTQLGRGVAQGPSLGPVLFIILMPPLCRCIQTCSVCNTPKGPDHTFNPKTDHLDLSPLRLLKFAFQGTLTSLSAGRRSRRCPRRNVHVVRGVFTVHLGGDRPAASARRQPEDLHSSACGKRWLVVRRLVFQGSHWVWPETSNEKKHKKIKANQMC